jgi:hypothetical protein
MGVKPDNSPIGYRCENDEAGERGRRALTCYFGIEEPILKKTFPVSITIFALMAKNYPGP